MSFLYGIWTRWLEYRGKQALLALLLVGCLFLILSAAIHRPGVDRIDLAFTRELQEKTITPLRWLMIGLTFLGSSVVLSLLSVALAIFLFETKRHLAAAFSLLTLIGLPLNVLLKDWIGRPRPSHDLVTVVLPTVGLSYPSGHAMASTMFFGWVGVLCWLFIQDKALRIQMAILAGAIALLICLSRIYLGAHWLSDVLGGITAGSFCLMLLTSLYRHYGKKEFTKSPPIGT